MAATAARVVRETGFETSPDGASSAPCSRVSIKLDTLHSKSKPDESASTEVEVLN
jgi:hypothetical protein